MINQLQKQCIEQMCIALYTLFLVTKELWIADDNNIKTKSYRN